MEPPARVSRHPGDWAAPGGQAAAARCGGQVLLSRAAPPGLPPLPPRASWSTPFFPLAGLIDRQRPSPQRRAVEPGNRGLGLRAVRHLDKAKAAGAPSVAIGRILLANSKVPKFVCPTCLL